VTKKISHPQPTHIAWRVAPSAQTLLDAIEAILRRPGLTDRHARAGAVRALLDAEARVQGCRRGGVPRRWMTAAEYAAYREEDPGYRHDPERHRQAAQKMSPRARKARAKKAARAALKK
jgi:hypothetical protein